jgi:arginyl-tRNA synthetase
MPSAEEVSASSAPACQNSRMKSLIDELSDTVAKGFAAAGLDGASVRVQRSDRPDLCQFQCNGALQAAATARKAPRQIAQQVVDALRGAANDETVFARLDVAGPGFINIDIADGFLVRHVERLSRGIRRACTVGDAGRRVLIDYGGANIAKPMHVGHLRSSIIGDCLKRVARFLGRRRPRSRSAISSSCTPRRAGAPSKILRRWKQRA